jgi:hypothetical protein
MLLILLSRSVIGDPHIWTHLGSVPSGAKPQAATSTLTTSGVDLKLENLMDGIRKMNRRWGASSFVLGRSSLVVRPWSFVLGRSSLAGNRPAGLRTWREVVFRPIRGFDASVCHPGLAPWAAFWRRFAADVRGHYCDFRVLTEFLAFATTNNLQPAARDKDQRRKANGQRRTTDDQGPTTGPRRTTNDPQPTTQPTSRSLPAGARY